MKLRQILLFAHLTVVVLLLCTLGNAWIPPNFVGNLNLLSLGFPYLMALHVLFTLIWVFKRKKIAIAFVLGSFLFYNPVRRWINFSPKTENLKSIRDIKVLTFNVKYGDFGWEKVKKYKAWPSEKVFAIVEELKSRFPLTQTSAASKQR